MTDVWWAIIRRPDNPKVQLYELGPEPFDAELARVRTQQGIPGGWVDIPGWDFSVAPGEPHPELMWSKDEILAARDQLEDAAGISGQRAEAAKLRATVDAAKAAGIPADTAAELDHAVRKLERAIRPVALSEVQAALAATPPSRATVHRRPVKSVPAAPKP